MLDTLRLIDATPFPGAAKAELKEYRAEGHCFDNFLRYIHFPCWRAIALWYQEEK